MATDEQIERVREMCLGTLNAKKREALIAVLTELATLRELRDRNEAEIRSLKSAYCRDYQWQVKQDPIFQGKPRRGWYCCDSSGMNYLHKDRRVTQGISDQELAFWPTEIEANVFLHEWLYGPPAALAKCQQPTHHASK